MTATAEDKATLRRRMLSLRRQLQSDIIAEHSNSIVARLLAWTEYRNAKTIMGYLAMPDEPQLDSFLMQALQDGKTVCVPRLADQYGYMDAVALRSLSDLSTGRLGLRMPESAQPHIIPPESIDLVLTPGVAFDQAGNRIGMGAGYYDRFFTDTSQAVLAGIAWSFQVLPHIAAACHDIPVAWLVTEKGIVSCSSSRKHTAF